MLGGVLWWCGGNCEGMGKIFREVRDLLGKDYQVAKNCFNRGQVGKAKGS